MNLPPPTRPFTLALCLPATALVTHSFAARYGSSCLLLTALGADQAAAAVLPAALLLTPGMPISPAWQLWPPQIGLHVSQAADRPSGVLSGLQPGKLL